MTPDELTAGTTSRRDSPGRAPTVDITDRIRNVLVDQISIDGDRARGSFPGGGDDLRSRVRYVARYPHTPGTLVRPLTSLVTHPCSSMWQPRPTRSSLFGTKRGGTNNT